MPKKPMLSSGFRLSYASSTSLDERPMRSPGWTAICTGKLWTVPTVTLRVSEATATNCCRAPVGRRTLNVSGPAVVPALCRHEVIVS